MENTSIELDDVARAGLTIVVDILLPGTEALPSGNAVGAHLELLDRTINADPRLVPDVVEYGRWAAEARPHCLKDALDWDARRIEKVVFALTAAYYMSSQVRRALRYPGQVQRPVSAATPDQKVSDELLAPVLGRGPIYVSTPD